jgi:predicted nuclease of predicted toxin-antitoxin system
MQARLLLDANLSWRSVAVLRRHFADCAHVDNIGLRIPAKDAEIWEYARCHGMMIVTNDEDFFDLSSFRGFPPQIIMLRTGNQSRQHAEQVLIGLKTRIEAFAASTECGVLEII